MATDTAKLVRYSPKVYPTLPEGQGEYLTGELRKVANAITSIEQVMVKLEARLHAGGL